MYFPRSLLNVPLGVSQVVYYGLLFGAAMVLPAYALYRWKPNHWFIKNIHVPVFMGSVGGIPPAATINFTPWVVVGVFFQYFVFKYYKNVRVLHPPPPCFLFSFMGFFARRKLRMSADLGLGTEDIKCRVRVCVTNEGCNNVGAQ